MSNFRLFLIPGTILLIFAGSSARVEALPILPCVCQAGSDRELLRQTFFGNEYKDKVAGFREHLGKIKALDSSPEVLEARKRIAEKLVQLGSKGGQTAQGYERMTLEESYDRAKVFLELALEYQPDNAKAKSMLDKIDGEKSDQLAAKEKEIDEAEFPPHAKSFQGDADAMAAKAFTFLNNRHLDVDGKLLQVRIAGDWKRYRDSEYRLDGDTVTKSAASWGLPIEAAFTKNDDPKVAQIIQMKLVTRADKPEPPFDRQVYTGGNRMMRINNLQGYSGGGSTSGSGAGLFRIPISLCLIALGTLAIVPLLQQKVPAVGEAMALLTPYTTIAGVVTLAFGVLGLLFNLLSPFRDLFPQLAAIVLGLGMGLSILIEKRSFGDAGKTASVPNGEEQADDIVDKAKQAMDKAGDVASEAMDAAQNLLIENQARIRQLDKYRIPLGIGCIVLGLIHLFAGGRWLF